MNMLARFLLYFGKGLLIAVIAVPFLLFVIIGTYEDTTAIDEFMSRFF